MTAADEARRRIERDLHDGTQQRLVALAVTLRAARESADGVVGKRLDEAMALLSEATEELRELARGIHPAVLTGAYFVVAEALTNVVRHADASRAGVSVAEREATLPSRSATTAAAVRMPREAGCEASPTALPRSTGRRRC